jgi:hypothetical protein
MALSPLALAGWPIALLTDLLLRKSRDLEWQTRKHAPGGSEMYLLFD